MSKAAFPRVDNDFFGLQNPSAVSCRDTEHCIKND